MGGDIAAWAAFRGMTVTLQDRSADLIQPALDRAKAFFDKRLKDPAAAAAALARLRMDVKGDAVARFDVVIEAIFENIDAKRALYAELEPKLKPGAVLATNTSSIKIETLCPATAGSKPSGRHSLLQSRGAIAIGGNRAGRAHRAAGGAKRAQVRPQARQAAAALQERARLRREPHFDALRQRSAVRPGRRHPSRGHRPCRQSIRHAYGADRIADVVGLDVSLHVGRVLADALQRRVPEILIKRVEQKKFGRKSGEGFYVWRDGKPIQA